MKLKYTLIFITFMGFCPTSEAQLLKRLKKKAEQAVERTILKKTDEVVTEKTENTIDSITKKREPNKSKEIGETEKNSGKESSNSALDLHTQAKKDFYKEDVIIKLHENGRLNQTQYFDANQVAARLEQNNQPKSGYIDSEGFIYGYNEREGQYNKSSMMALGSQGMMVPTMMVEAYKLPPEPVMANLEKQQSLGMVANPFNGIVEFAFIYTPEQFRYEDFKETKETIKGKTHTKFQFLNEPGYVGNYVLFDDKDRLVKVYSNKTATDQSMDGFQMDMTPPGERIIEYQYTSVDVQLPDAKEVKSQGQGMMEMVMGSFKKDKNASNINEVDYDTSDSKGQVKSVKNALKNHKVTANDLPESYDFEWQYETEMVLVSRKKEVINMTFLIKEGATYQATQMVGSKSKDMGNMTMLFDAELNTMIMFMEGQGQKYLQMYPIPEPKQTNEKVEYNITELSSKTILGFSCKGLQMEDDKYVFKVYHAEGTPVTLSNFLNFRGNNNMNLPDIDPRILSQFSNGLIMEMELIDKKKSKNNVIITAKSLEKKPKQLIKNNYKVMDLFSGARALKN